jgi:hypothetical protein
LTPADPNPKRRWILAIALAIAINEVLIGFLQFPRDQPEEPPHTVMVKIDRMPTPRPTPKPTPPPIVHVPPHATPAPKQEIAAARAIGPKAPKHGGKPARHVVKTKVVATVPVRSASGKAAGATGTGSGQGAGAAEDGGGDNGTTAGTGSGGNGTGAVNANTPCGDVMFSPVGPPKNPNTNTQIERVAATVTFPDGHPEKVLIPYPWPYTNPEQTDPWSGTQLRLHPDDPVSMILPPPGTDTSSFEPLLKYILDHTTKDGLTTLAPCPKSPK